MQLSMIGLVAAAADPTASGAWFAEHFGFTVGIDLGWYVNTQLAGHPTVSLDFVQRDHESWPAATRGKDVVGTLIAFVVDNVDTEHDRLSAAGLEVVLPLVTEPWGQRRFQLAAPDGLLVEVLQQVPPDPAWLTANGFGVQ